MKMKVIVAAALAVPALALATYADITITSSVDNQGVGGIMNMKGTQTVMISGDKSRTSSELKMTNKVIGFLGGGKPQQSAEIVRLDKELMWNLDLKDKKYTELTFAQMKAMFDTGLQAAQAEEAQHPAEDSVQVNADIKVEKTGKSQTIAGYKADEVIITMAFKGTDKESGKSGTMNMTIDTWVSKDVPGYQEYQNFHKTFAEKLGFGGETEGGLGQALKGFGVNAQTVQEKMGDIEGIPLLTVASILPEGLDTLAARSIDSAKAAQPQAEQEVQPQEAEAPKEKALKKLGGLFGKKKSKEQSEPSKSESKQAPPYLFHMTTTVTQISSSAVPPAEFEVPSDFAKKTN
ncbi:hypothetical protein C3F09_02540 [candidate division GN15 bacterium]|uniref:DUF4412 domain-containing protein n=1 Tax=candidate division GN15 bacterium TaxID=2072418 RepID=A0A855XA01_9BACT|nr:MAG: hypothetical protein C3F09_02540 [candidate division GN15 bacterium]